MRIALGGDGRVLVKCRVGCPTEEILSAVGCDWVDLFPSDHDEPLPNGQDLTAAVRRPPAAEDDIAHAASARDVAVQPDGRIVVAGNAFTGPGDTDFAAARLNPDGTPDLTFGTGGRTSQTPGDPTFRGLGQGIALQPDGGIVVASFTAVVRLNPDGTPDRTFGADGRTAELLNEQGQGVELWAPAILPGGKILVAGNAAVSQPFEGHFFGGYLVARLLGDTRAPLVVAGGTIDGTAVPIRASGGAYTPGEPIAFFPGAGVGVRTAAADFTGDGVADLVGGTGPGGGPRVAVLDGATGRRVADFSPSRRRSPAGCTSPPAT